MEEGCGRKGQESTQQTLAMHDFCRAALQMFTNAPSKKESKGNRSVVAVVGKTRGGVIMVSEKGKSTVPKRRQQQQQQQPRGGEGIDQKKQQCEGAVAMSQPKAASLPSSAAQVDNTAQTHSNAIDTTSGAVEEAQAPKKSSRPNRHRRRRGRQRRQQQQQQQQQPLIQRPQALLSVPPRVWPQAQAGQSPVQRTGPSPWTTGSALNHAPSPHSFLSGAMHIPQGIQQHKHKPQRQHHPQLQQQPLVGPAPFLFAGGAFPFGMTQPGASYPAGPPQHLSQPQQLVVGSVPMPMPALPTSQLVHWAMADQHNNGGCAQAKGSQHRQHKQQQQQQQQQHGTFPHQPEQLTPTSRRSRRRYVTSPCLCSVEGIRRSAPLGA